MCLELCVVIVAVCVAVVAVLWARFVYSRALDPFAAGAVRQRHLESHTRTQAALTLLMLSKCLGRYRPRTRGLFPLRWQRGVWLTWVAAGEVLSD